MAGHEGAGENRPGARDLSAAPRLSPAAEGFCSCYDEYRRLLLPLRKPWTDTDTGSASVPNWSGRLAACNCCPREHVNASALAFYRSGNIQVFRQARLLAARPQIFEELRVASRIALVDPHPVR